MKKRIISLAIVLLSVCSVAKAYSYTTPQIVKESDCKRGNAIACYYASVAYRASNPEKENDYLERACDLGCGAACIDRSVKYVRLKDNRQAGKWLEKACNKGDPKGCRLLAYAYEDGIDGFRQSYVKAKSYYQRGCAMADESSCQSLKDIRKAGY